MPEMIPTRFGYSDGLLELGATNPRVVVLDADLSRSTTTEKFQKKYPDRFFQMGICEQNMMVVAAGMAVAGDIPFATDYGVFLLGRAMDQLRVSVCYTHLNVKLGGAHAGVSVGADGATHQALEEVAWTRCLPGMTVIVPADYHDTVKAVKAVAEMYGPCYIRFGRAPMPVVTKKEDPFVIGRGNMYRDGKDLTIFSMGAMLWQALIAAEELSAKGIKARVVNMHTVKPLDEQAVLAAARETGAIVTAEEHQYFGGLGSAVAEVLVENHPCPMKRVGVKDRFGESGTPDELFREYGLLAEDIIEAAYDVLERKKK
ncbi:MAG TPA: transketolase family protein [Planctomycetota bacterium]|nr:transketolase family protein [Planctomycetota bacterium]